MPDNTFTVPEHKYEINKTSTADADDKYMNKSIRCMNSKSPKFIKSLNIHSLGSVFL